MLDAFQGHFDKKAKAHNANHQLLKWLMMDGVINPKAQPLEPFKQLMVCIVSLYLIVKMTSKCIKHQPDGLLQSAIFHTNLWEKYLLGILKYVVTTIVVSRV